MGGIESVECSTGMEWWNGIVEWPFSPLMNNLRGGGGRKGPNVGLAGHTLIH